LIKDTFKPLFNIRRGETIILISDPKNPSKIKSEDSITNVLKLTHFDMVIDLNTNFYLDASRILSLIPAKMKVGFKSRFADLFYNIQLDVSKSGIAENGYYKVQLMLENS
jgi:ADP-heptose:LPS heptosyltransferase